MWLWGAGVGGERMGRFRPSVSQALGEKLVIPVAERLRTR